MKQIFLVFSAIAIFLLLVCNVLAITGSISPNKFIFSGDIGKTFYRSVVIKNTNDFPVALDLSADSSSISILGDTTGTIPALSNYTANFTARISSLGNESSNFIAKLSGNSEELTLASNVNLEGTGGTSDIEINIDMLESFVSGSEAIANINIKNTGTTENNYSLSVSGYDAYASLLDFSPQSLQLSANQSGDSVVTLKINNDAVGNKYLNIRAEFNGQIREQRVYFTITERQNAIIAYVVKDVNNPDSEFISVIEELGYEYELIDDSQVAFTNFSEYDMILLGNEIIYNVPVNNYKSLIANPNYYSGWSQSKASTTRLSVYRKDKDISISQAIPDNFNSYTTSGSIYYLTGKKYSTSPVFTTGNSTVDLGKYVVAVKDSPRRVFFGITKSISWTTSSRQAFMNSMQWIIEGEDRDGDGYYSDYDCNNNDANSWQNLSGYVDSDRDGYGTGSLINVCSGNTLSAGYSNVSGDCDDFNLNIHPNANEIPYNGIDENCDLLDLVDVDHDGYNYPGDCNDNNANLWRNIPAYADNDKDGYGTGSLINVCSGALLISSYSTIAGDCNDNNANIYPNANEIMDSIDQNCVNDAPVFIGNINNISWNEDGTYHSTINLKEYFKDTDGNNLSYSYSTGSNIIVQINNGVASLSSKNDWSGSDSIVFYATDGALNASSNTITISVSSVNDAPVINFLGLNISLNEDFGNYSVNFSIYGSDIDNTANELTWSIESVSGNSFNASVENNILKLNSIQDKYCTDLCGVMIKLSDSGKSDSKFLNIVINPVNDAPVLKKEIENITWNQNTNNTINLRDYFSDVDADNLAYTFSGNSKISIEINNGIALFFPEAEWNGTEEVVFTASDSQYNVSSNPALLNVLYVKKPPKFNEINCTSDLIEENEYSCELSAADAENDEIWFEIGNKNNLNCEVNGTTLTYSGITDYFGNASCVLKAVDVDGFSEYLFNVNIENVNDAPKFTSFYPENNTKVLFNTTKEFRVSARDPDNDDFTITWFLGDEVVGNGTRYLFNKPLGTYEIRAVANDSLLNSTNTWNVNVLNYNDFKCSDVRGFICSESQICNGNILNVYDTGKCCSVACAAKPPEFINIKKGNINSSVDISITNNIDIQYYTGDIIKVNLETVNDLDNDIKDAKVYAYLYRTDKEDIITKSEQEIDINKDSRYDFKIELQIPRDIDETKEYYVFVKIDAESKGNDYYNQEYRKIRIARAENDVIVEDIEIQPEGLVCGDSASLNIELKNYGSANKAVTLKAYNKELKINAAYPEFTLERYKEDDSAEKTLDIKIPSDAKAGSYIVIISAVHGDKTESHDFSITLDECKKVAVKTTPIISEPVLIRSESKVLEKLSFNNTLMIAVSAFSVVLIILFVFAAFFILKRPAEKKMGKKKRR